MLDPLDLVGIGSSEFRLSGETLEEITRKQEVGLAAVGITVTTRAGRRARRRRRLRARGRLAARRRRPVRSRQVDAAGRADGSAAGSPRQRLLRRARPLLALRRAAPADRLRPAGRRRPPRADGRAVAHVRGRAAVRPRCDRGGATQPGRGRARRARSRGAPEPAGGEAVRRPAQARQRGDRAPDEAVAPLPRRAHVGPRPGARAEPDGSPSLARRRRPHRHRRHPLDREPEPLRPRAVPRSGRPRRLLRACAARARLLRLRLVPGGVPRAERRHAGGVEGTLPLQRARSPAT